MSKKTLLVEIGTEELPPTAAKNLADTLSDYVASQLAEAGFTYSKALPCVTPRRLVMFLFDASEKQPEQTIERKGPVLKAAYDKNGEPSKAALGFAASCGVEIHDLQTLETDKGAWLYFKSTEAGKTIHQVLPEILEQGLTKLPIPKPMRWGSSEVEFVRPVHWVVMMYGSEVITCKIKGITASNISYGHRFHAPQAITLSNADDYIESLRQAKVIVDFSERQDSIRRMLEECAEKHNAELKYNDSLLEEVTNLVEWPSPIVGEFSQAFLEIPLEALVATMQDAQRYFPMFSKLDGALLPYFITIANIESRNPLIIKQGNERVIKPRFEDADFFWRRDRQRTLESRTKDLQGILFEKELGSILEKTQRIAHLASALCNALDIDDQHATRAALLCKADLVCDMVNEFPKLQGIMGRYYAQHDKEPDQVSQAIEQHYQPLQSGSTLPISLTGKIVALCDRIDTLVGIFATGKKPSGVKDPYALRRAALGVVRICIEGQVDFDLQKLLECSAHSLENKLDTSNSSEEVLDFILDRLRGYFIDQGHSPDTFEAVRSVKPTQLLDFANRMEAIKQFRLLSEAGSLAAANKRIGNILKKAKTKTDEVDTGLLVKEAEKYLFQQLSELEEIVSPKFQARNYNQAMTDLAQLKPAIDQFFDEVMVMDDNEQLRNNRINLLSRVHRLFMTVADISLLQS